MADYSERDEAMADQARFARVEQCLETLLYDGLTMTDVKELLQRVVATMEFKPRG